MIGENLKTAFTKEGLIVKEVSKKSGISKGTIDNWVNKGKEPRINALYEVCKALNITLEQAVDGETGVEYVRQVVRPKLPPRIAAIVEDLMLLDDKELDIIQAAAHTAAETKKGKGTGTDGPAG